MITRLFSFFRTSSKTRKTRLNQKGFSLFEILIVVGIIAGLMAAILPKIFENQNRSKVGQTKIIMNNLIQALTMYQNDCQRFPGSLDGLVTNDGCSNWTGPYIKEIPKDAWGTPFSYSAEEGGSNYLLKSMGADKREGGDGINKDISSDDLQ